MKSAKLDWPTNGINSPRIRYNFLDTGIAHFLEARTCSQNDTACYHLIYGLSSGTNDTAYETDTCTEEHEIPSSEDVTQPASDRNEDGCGKCP